MSTPQINFSPRHPGQKRVVELWEKSQALIITGPAGTGKAQPLSSTIMTPSGPKAMGDIEIGDLVCTPTGVSSVIGVFPQGEKEIYRVTFDDGSSTLCCLAHLWTVGHIRRNWKLLKTVDTKYLIENHRTPQGRRVLYLPSHDPVEMAAQEYPLDPYIIGVMLADGGLTRGASVLSSTDDFILSKVNKLLPQEYELRKRTPHNPDKCDYLIVRKVRTGHPSYVSMAFKKLGLWGKKSPDKHIPEEYLKGSIEQRTALLHGMMDGDGSVEITSGMPIYYTTSEKLAKDFRYLVASLGGTCKTKMKYPSYYSEKYQKYVKGLPCYIIHPCLPNSILPFSLPRKLDLVKPRTKYFPRRYVDKVEFVGEMEAQCIKIENENGLYLTDNFIVTHNTAVALAMALKYAKKVILCRPAVSVDEELGFAPGTIEEKLAPWLSPFSDVLGDLSETRYLAKWKNIETVGIGLLGGRTVKNAVLIVDEAQNATRAQLKMALTRCGENGKIVLCGDFSQTQLKGHNPLKDIADRLTLVEGANVVHFLPEHQLRSPFVQRVLEVL